MKTLAALSALLLLAACGFTPMYGASEGAHSQARAADGLDRIGIDVIPNAEGVMLRNKLIDRFYRHGYPAAPRYRLSVAPLVERIRDFDVTVESETTSRQVILSTTFTLRDGQSGATVLQRQLSAYASYNVIGSQFTTRVSEADAREAAIADMARQIETQLALYFNR